MMLCSKRQRTGGAGAKPRSKLEEVMQKEKQAKSMQQAREQQQHGQQQQQQNGRCATIFLAALPEWRCFCG